MKRELTPYEIERMVEYYHKYFAIGVSTSGCEQQKVEEAFHKIYNLIGYKLKSVVWAPSPIACIELKKQQSGEPLDDYSIRSEASSDGWYGEHEAYWLAFYYYCNRVLNIEYPQEDLDKLDLWMILALNINWWYPYEDTVFVSHKPVSIEYEVAREHFINEKKVWDVYQLHGDGIAAIKFMDGNAIYALHGIQVPKWLALTPPDDIDPKMIIQLENADQRERAVAKVGVDNIYRKLGGKPIDRKIIEIKGQKIVYELLTLDIGDGRPREYLKMLNPSTGSWHIEGVEPGTISVDQALAWRRWGLQQSPAILT
jgi:hypothetical protein